jgi:EAL domain-containing protein (putative c-di-GMP-specific phosphodiesterase class I)
MALSVGVTVVAEGVETPEQLQFLAEHHCDEAKGYLISRAHPADVVLDVLRTLALVVQPEGRS